MFAITIAFLLFALVGHAALWVGFVNRVHALGAPRWQISFLTRIGHAILVVVPIAAAWLWWTSDQTLVEWTQRVAQYPAALIYAVVCWCLAIATSIIWIKRHWLSKPPAAIRDGETSYIDVAANLGRKPISGVVARLLSCVPGNQVLQIAVHERQAQLARIPSPLDGLSIVHLSDFHMTGRISLEYFHEIVRQTGELRPDMIAITGDIFDEMDCLDWIPTTLATLSAPLGVYFVLGNHDQYTGQERRVRQALSEAGLIDLGGRFRHLDAAGVAVIVAGNELPWFVPAADMEHCPKRSADRPQLRILLSHSPDQFGWARRWDFDLMLAGHTHGGQICLPIVGPIFAPSWHGVKHAGGTFYMAPTLMHVSRGISSELPIRINCPPEVTKLVLRTATAAMGSRETGVSSQFL